MWWEFGQQSGSKDGNILLIEQKMEACRNTFAYQQVPCTWYLVRYHRKYACEPETQPAQQFMSTGNLTALELTTGTRVTNCSNPGIDYGI